MSATKQFSVLRIQPEEVGVLPKSGLLKAVFNSPESPLANYEFKCYMMAASEKVAAIQKARDIQDNYRALPTPLLPSLFE